MQVRLLGSVGLADGEGWTWLRGARVRTVLAALALHADAVVATEDLIQAVWGDRPPRTAANQIQIAISFLRTRMGPAAAAALVTQPPGYVLRTGGAVTTDLQEFRALIAAADEFAARRDWLRAREGCEDALAVWRGTAAQDVTSAYLQGALAGLDHERAAAVERRLCLDVVLGRGDRILPEVRSLIDADPMRERLWYLLVLAHAVGGRQAAALDAYRSARKALITELGLEPGDELQRLERAVLEGVPGRALAEVEGWLAPDEEAHSGAWLTPHQLPAGIPDFVGRVKEAERIAEHITAGSPDGPTVIAISGFGGVGKTTLAVRAARIAEQRFPAGSLFTDLRGTDADRPDAAAVMSALLLSLGVPAPSIPSALSARTGLYRSITARRNLLIVLDNAASEDQVRDLLPGAPGCVVLITSRRKLVGLDGVHHVDLRPLSEQEARGLLASLAGPARIAADRHAADQIITLCDRLPLAVRLVGLRLRDRADLPVARLAQRLSDERDRLDEMAAGGREVRASIALGVAQLDPEAALLLREIALLPAPEVPLWLAAAAHGCRTTRAERLLDHLGQASLVEARGDSRYRPHDLIRLYARERALIEDSLAHRMAASRRAYATLLRTAREADDLLRMNSYPMPPVPDDLWIAPDPLPTVGDPAVWFEDHRSLLAGAARDAAVNGWFELAAGLAVVPTHAFGASTFDELWLDAMRFVLDVPGRRTPLGEAAVRLALGGLLRHWGDPREALVQLRTARLIYRREGDLRRSAVAATQLGMAARKVGRRRLEHAAISWAVATFQELPPGVHLGWTLLAWANGQLEEGGDLDTAAAVFDRALELMRAGDERMGEANILGCLGIVRARQDRPREAIAFLQTARKVFADCGGLSDQGHVEVALGWNELRQGELVRATSWQRHALATARQAHMGALEVDVLRLGGEILLRQDRPGEAIGTARQAVRVADEAGMQVDQAESQFLLARAHHAAGDIAAARASARQAVQILAAIEHPRLPVMTAWIDSIRPAQRRSKAR